MISDTHTVVYYVTRLTERSGNQSVSQGTSQSGLAESIICMPASEIAMSASVSFACLTWDSNLVVDWFNEVRQDVQCY